jgi:putative CocE/NonD family hydrolase
VAGFNPPHLDAIAPWDATADWYRDVFYPGGIRNVVWPKFFGLGVQPGFAAFGTAQAVADGEADCAALSPEEQAARAAGNFAFESERHPYFDDYWQQAPITRTGNIDIPVLGCQSWHDSAVGSRTAELYTSQAPHPDRTWFVGTNGQHGSCLPADADVVRFMDRYVKGEDNGWETTPHLLVGYDVPVGEVNPPYEREPGPPAAWFSAPAGGAAAVTPVTLHLHAEGSMGRAPSAAPDSRSFRYPLPSSSSGQFLMAEPGEMSGWQIYNAPRGSLSYTTPALAHDVEVVGPASADLLVSSTAQDTDLQVTVTEVRPDGQEQWLQRGWLRLSHRKLDPDLSTILRPYHTHREPDAAPLTPNTPVLARVEVMPFAHVFRAGSSIRLTVEAPTGVTLGHRFDYLKTPAVNTVHHDPAVGSRLVLGTIPGGRALKPLSACNTVNMEPCRANVIPVPAGRLSLE